MTYLIIICLIALSAIFSGLTIGMFSLDRGDLKIQGELGNRKAQKIYKLRKNSNLLLCTLLIGNVAVNSTLSIFLGSITTGFTAGIMATTLIVLFGEITPQAIFARHALNMGAKFAWLTRFFIIILWPICYPLSLALDKMLGKESSTYYTKKELVKLIEHYEDFSGGVIDGDEEKILKGALSYSDKKVSDIMTPYHKVFSLNSETILDKEIIQKINSMGHSRIPIFCDNHHNVVGILYTKDLVDSDLHQKKAIEVARKSVIHVDHNKKLDEVLNSFKKTRNHLYLVRDPDNIIKGIVTVEDVIEEIIGDEIVDEFDREIAII